MKKIIISVAVAAMALSTTASALEDIKVNGQAKVWYETNNAGDNDLFHAPASVGEVAFKAGLTGKQGSVGFGAEITSTDSMGLESRLVYNVRSLAANQGMYLSKAYITAPIAPDTVLKFGRQELDTPFAFTEKWNVVQNNFDAAVAINSSIKNVTLIGAYVGQTNTQIADIDPTNLAAYKGRTTADFEQMHGGAFAVGALFKNDMFSANGWAYSVRDVGNGGAFVSGIGTQVGLGHVEAYWLDAGVSVAGVNVKAVAAMMDPNFGDSTTGFALCAKTDIAGVNLSAAGATVGEGIVPLGNTATNFKKTKLPTAGVYTDGLYVAQPESTSFKLKAAGKLGTTGLALQGVMNDNDARDDLKTTEVDLIVTQKLGDFNFKGIVMHRDFDTKDAQQHVRVIASVDF